MSRTSRDGARRRARRTPILVLLRRVVAMFLRPAMFGWTLKAFSLTAILLTPLAVISAYGSVPPGSRRWLLASAAGVLVVAYGLHRLGRRLRNE